MIHHKVTRANIHITNSYTIKKPSEMRQILEYIQESLPGDYPVKHRKISGMLLEWSAHNLLYRMNYKPEQTGSVDLDMGESWLHKILYFILGLVGFLFPGK